MLLARDHKQSTFGSDVVKSLAGVGLQSGKHPLPVSPPKRADMEADESS
eukprot:gene2899-4117_t